MSKKELNKDNNTILLIDTSYCCFYRWTALQNWIKLNMKDKVFDDDYMYSEDEIFMEKYDKRFWEGFIPIMKSFNIEKKNILFAIDCPRDSIWRVKHYPDYKKTRSLSSDIKQKDCKNIFMHTINELLPKFKKDHNINYIRSDGAEADDIVATAVKYIREKDENCKIIIIANDHDYLQLIDENLEIYALASTVKKMKLINDKSIGTGKENLLFKILKGDSSDNIKSPFKKCGDKTALKYVHSEEELEKAFKKNPGSEEKFNLNKLIIDFNEIPDYITKDITNQLENTSLLNL